MRRRDCRPTLEPSYIGRVRSGGRGMAARQPKRPGSRSSPVFLGFKRSSRITRSSARCSKIMKRDRLNHEGKPGVRVVTCLKSGNPAIIPYKLY
jgi:hypothetical protein